jgi:DUF971 family protein
MSAINSQLPPNSKVPVDITVHESSRVLELDYGAGESYKITFELMRVYSPSAEVQGHGPGQETLQTGKRDVHITQIEPIGNYAIKPTFSDGHSSGIFSWDYLYRLCTQQESLWKQYLQKLLDQGVSRDSVMTPPPAHSCSVH